LAKPHWIAVDWGTSNLRVWGMGGDSRPLFERQAERGMARLRPGEFPDVLAEILADAEVSDEISVLISGMAGARQGWVEAPYLDLPADLATLGRYLVNAPAPGHIFHACIVPGVCRRNPGREDVMRGEETQLLGVARLHPGFGGLVVKAGTHSKWSRLEGTVLTEFSTSMTGELYAVLSAHSVLHHSLDGEAIGPGTEDGISAGLDQGLAEPGRLTESLFRTRAASLLSSRRPDWCHGFLSGLLVGAEIGGKKKDLEGQEILIMGGARMVRLYGAALGRLGISAGAIDETEATLAGLAAVREQTAK
jgi:2-dehydro-3-deoxygalactonokinase